MSACPDRDGGQVGDGLWLVGTLGDSAAGLALLREDGRAAGVLVDIYRRPIPLLHAGQALAPHAHAMMDVSDGLLLDARRMAEASGCAIAIELGDLPLSSAFVEARGDDLEARLFAATGGDDYALLGAFAPDFDPATLSLPPGTRMVRIGALEAGGPQLRLAHRGEPVELPERLGFEHDSADHRGQHRPAPASPVADRH